VNPDKKKTKEKKLQQLNFLRETIRAQRVAILSPRQMDPLLWDDPSNPHPIKLNRNLKKKSNKTKEEKNKERERE